MLMSDGSWRHADHVSALEPATRLGSLRTIPGGKVALTRASLGRDVH